MSDQRTSKPKAIRKGDGYEYITFKRYRTLSIQEMTESNTLLKPAATCVHGLLILIRLTVLFRWAMPWIWVGEWKKSFIAPVRKERTMEENNYTSGFGLNPSSVNLPSFNHGPKQR